VSRSPGSKGPIPAIAGIGLRAPHVADVGRTPARVGWVEVHSENYFFNGGPARAALAAIRRDVPVSLHGVGLSLGSAAAPDARHLAQLRALVDWIEPAFVSEHLSWGATAAVHLNDLLPLPYTEESLDRFCENVAIAQERLGRRILIENITSYLRWRHSCIPECQFIAEVVRRSGCGVLLDVNNLFVNEANHGDDARTFIAALPVGCVEEVHLAGFTEQTYGATSLLVDTHSRSVAPAVWTLYRETLERFGPLPTLIEWDADLPALDVLLDEARRADAAIQEVSRARAA
jgi:uncharacterized protein (UPF0276 family)